MGLATRTSGLLTMWQSSSKDIHFFWVVPPTESPKIMGLRAIHSPEALRWQGGLSFCLWCGKDGQNEGMVVNHLQTRHYHLDFICGQCLEYFTTSANAMHHHSQLCKPVPAGINNDNDNVEEESNINDNGKDDDFVFG